MKLLGGIEAGGTKFVCGIGYEDGKIIDRTSFPTTTPEETMTQVFQYFEGKSIEAIGIGSFGPIDPIASSSGYGFITTTPKPHWGQYNIVGAIQERLALPIAFDTDVNGAALAEYKWGAAKGLDSCLYITIGTGIGAGAVVGEKSFMDFLILKWDIFMFGGCQMIRSKVVVHTMETVSKVWRLDQRSAHDGENPL